MVSEPSGHIGAKSKIAVEIVVKKRGKLAVFGIRGGRRNEDAKESQ
jgi:hypothetical protein